MLVDEIPLRRAETEVTEIDAVGPAVLGQFLAHLDVLFEVEEFEELVLRLVRPPFMPQIGKVLRRRVRGSLEKDEIVILVKLLERGVLRFQFAFEAKQLFGLAFVLGLLRQVGPQYVFNAGGSTDIDVPLGEGSDTESRLQTAADAFLAGGYATDVRRKTREEEERDTPVLFTRCMSWIKSQQERQASSSYPEFFKEYVVLVEDYARSIESF